MAAVTVVCHGPVEPARDEARGKTRYRCPQCGLDLQVRDDLHEQLFAPAVEAKVAEVHLLLLISALARTRR